MSAKNKILFYLITYSCCFSSSLSWGAESQVLDLFIKRHSGISFDASRYVDNTQLKSLIEAARWSPSSFNDQPWNFIICDRLQTPEAYEKALASIFGTQQDWVQNAPVLVIVVARTKFSYNNDFNEWAEYDTGAAALSFSLQATDLNLMTHQLGGFDPDVIRVDFGIPEDHKPMAIIALGYESADEEPQERERLPIGTNFFLGEWGSGFQEQE
jgi:nitroreductase